MKKLLYLFFTVLVVTSCVKNELTLGESLPKVTIHNTSIPEDKGCDYIYITLDQPSEDDVVLEIGAVPQTATEDDYELISNSVTIPKGETETAVWTFIKPDLLDEPDETFTVTGKVKSGNVDSKVANGTVAITQYEGTIPYLLVGDASAVEGEDVLVPISLSIPMSTDIVVVVTTTTDTAGTDDYTEVETTITIPSGQTMVTVTLSTVDDTEIEVKETFLVTGRATNVINEGFLGVDSPHATLTSLAPDSCRKKKYTPPTGRVTIFD